MAAELESAIIFVGIGVHLPVMVFCFLLPGLRVIMAIMVLLDLSADDVCTRVWIRIQQRVRRDRTQI